MSVRNLDHITTVPMSLVSVRGQLGYMVARRLSAASRWRGAPVLPANQPEAVAS